MAMMPFEVLTLLKTTLATLPGVASCKIGIEANVTAADYPLIRIVPTRLSAESPDFAKATLAITIYFGDQLLEAADGLEAVYAGLLTLDAAIREAALFDTVGTAWTVGQQLTVTYLDTVFDEDRLPGRYKMMASRFEVEG
jgi:hypothetical protein